MDLSILHQQVRLIYNELYKLYINEIEVNKPFDELVFSYIPPEYCPYKTRILCLVAYEIPSELVIDFEYKFEFCEDIELYELFMQLKKE